MFEKVLELCIKENKSMEQIKMERNIAMYHLNINKIDKAIELMKEVIKKAYDKRCYNHWLYFNCDLAYIYGYIRD